MSASPTECAELSRILLAVGRGDQRAFAELYRLTSPRLFGVCLRMLRDRGEAEDALQETYATVWRRAESFDPARAGAITWLVTLARNKAIDRLRRHREQPLDDPDRIDLADEHQPSPAQHADASQERQRLQRCLDQLEPQQQSAVRAAFFSGATYNELAARSGVPLATMKSWIRRSLIRLRSCLEQHDAR
jgi:RNA polymerase sigma factor, sigma-70 family